MEQKIYWYSYSEKALVELEPSKEELEGITSVKKCLPSVAKAIRASSMGLVPVLPIWVYGTLLSGKSAHELIESLALPEFKPMTGFKSGVQLYTNPDVPYPAALLKEGASTYMERYLILPKDLEVLNHYEGAPDLYSLASLPDGTGYFYSWNLGFSGWKESATGDFR